MREGFDNLLPDPKSTRTQLLVDFIGEQLSTNGDYDGYVGGVVSLAAAANWLSVSITLPGTPERIEHVLNGGWRGQRVVVRQVAVAVYPQVVEDGYYERDYADTGEQSSDAVTLFDGLIDSGRIAGGNRVEYTARHSILSKSSVPGIRFGAPINYHIPPAGMSVKFKDVIYTIEGAHGR